MTTGPSTGPPRWRADDRTMVRVGARKDTHACLVAGRRALGHRRRRRSDADTTPGLEGRIGAAGGAAVGAIVGDNPAIGAAVGGAVGTVVGALWQEIHRALK